MVIGKRDKYYFLSSKIPREKNTFLHVIDDLSKSYFPVTSFGWAACFIFQTAPQSEDAAQN